MAKFYLDRLRRKYGYTGGALQDLMRQIIDVNSGNIARATARISKDHYERAVRRFPKGVQKKFVLPDISEALPKRSVFIRKAAERGKRLTDDLRDSLTGNLRDTLQDFDKTGKQSFITRRGVAAGRINPELVERFEGRITKTFWNYTKRDPSYGIPANIHDIAVTEVRSAADNIKWEYVKALRKRNEKAWFLKRWKHNKSLSKEPRPHHMAIDGQEAELEEPFVLGNGVRIMYPHDPEADAEEVINCHCDFDVIISMPREPEKAPPRWYERPGD